MSGVPRTSDTYRVAIAYRTGFEREAPEGAR